MDFQFGTAPDRWRDRVVGLDEEVPLLDGRLETQGNLARTLVKAKRYDEAMPHLEKVLRRDLPPNLRIDLGDPLFDRMRTMHAFRELATEVSRRQKERNKTGLGPDSASR